MELLSDCIAWECKFEFDDAMWAARAVESKHNDYADKRYFAGRFEQAVATIARRTGHTRTEVTDHIRYLATRAEVAS